MSGNGSVESSGAGSGDGPDDIITAKDPNIYLPIYVMTAIFGGIFILAPLFVRKGPNQGLIRCCIWITTFSLWVLWFTVYVAQMNPLMGPRLKNTSMAWISHTWGKSPVEVPHPPTEGGEDVGGEGEGDVGGEDDGEDGDEGGGENEDYGPGGQGPKEEKTTKGLLGTGSPAEL